MNTQAKPEQLTEEMKDGMARMYSDDGIRAYLIHSIQVANKNLIVSMNKGDDKLGMFYANRIKTIEGIIESAKASFLSVKKRTETQRVESLQRQSQEHEEQTS